MEEEPGGAVVDGKRSEIVAFADVWWSDNDLGGVKGVFVYLSAELKGKREQRRL